MENIIYNRVVTEVEEPVYEEEIIEKPVYIERIVEKQVETVDE